MVVPTIITVYLDRVVWQTDMKVSEEKANHSPRRRGGPHFSNTYVPRREKKSWSCLDED
jgi:hypothetical protein